MGARTVASSLASPVWPMSTQPRSSAWLGRRVSSWREGPSAASATLRAANTTEWQGTGTALSEAAERPPFVEVLLS